MTYDHWKTAEPDPYADDDLCDSCGVPVGHPHGRDCDHQQIADVLDGDERERESA